MRIALYYPWVYLTSGAERTILELTGRSRHDWTVFTNRFEAANTFPGFADRDVVVLDTVPIRRTVFAVAKAGWKLVRQKLPLDDYDALLVVCEGLGDMVVFRAPPIPKIALCLTPLRVVFDPVYRDRYMQDHSWLARTLVRAGSPAYRTIDRIAWRHYDHVFCISEEVRQRVLRGRLAEASKLDISYVGLGFYPPCPGDVQGDYFLLPGRIMWTKNIELAIEAFKIFSASHAGPRPFRLVVTGMVDQKSRPYLEKLRALAGNAPVEFTIAPSDAELQRLYENCYGVLFTAFNEDWGIVPIEGMAFGKPVIATDRGGPRESIQNGVQGFLEEPEPRAFAARMGQLAADPEAALAMGCLGRERSKLFTWERLTSQIDSKLSELCGQPASMSTRSCADSVVS